MILLYRIGKAMQIFDAITIANPFCHIFMYIHILISIACRLLREGNTRVPTAASCDTALEVF